MNLLKLRYKADYATRPHGRDLPKPNEDRLLVDEERGVFIVLDGVTRAHSEYEQTPYESAAGDVGDILLREVYAHICDHISDPDPRVILEGAVERANALIKDYRSKKSEEEWSFYPSTVGIISILRDDTLHYLCVGDCIGVLLRGSSRMLFGRELPLEAIDLCHIKRSDRYALHCNHPENSLSYTVFNGDDAVMDGVEYSFIDIHEGDTLFLSSDGVDNYLKYEKIADLRMQTADEIISLSGKYDIPPYADYIDDKALIKLSF